MDLEKRKIEFANLVNKFEKIIKKIDGLEKVLQENEQLKKKLKERDIILKKLYEHNLSEFKNRGKNK